MFLDKNLEWEFVKFNSVWYRFLYSHALGHFSMLSLFQNEGMIFMLCGYENHSSQPRLGDKWNVRVFLISFPSTSLRTSQMNSRVIWVRHHDELVTAPWRISLVMMSMRRCYQVQRSSANFGTTQMSWRKESIHRKWASCQNGGWRTGSVLFGFVLWSWSLAERSQSHSACFFMIFCKTSPLPLRCHYGKCCHHHVRSQVTIM